MLLKQCRRGGGTMVGEGVHGEADVEVPMKGWELSKMRMKVWMRSIEVSRKKNASSIATKRSTAKVS